MAGFWQSAAALVLGGASVLWARDHFKPPPPAASPTSAPIPTANPVGPMRAQHIMPGAAFDPVTIQSGGAPALPQNDINRMRDAARRH